MGCKTISYREAFRKDIHEAFDDVVMIHDHASNYERIASNFFDIMTWRRPYGNFKRGVHMLFLYANYYDQKPFQVPIDDSFEVKIERMNKILKYLKSGKPLREKGHIVEV